MRLIAIALMLGLGACGLRGKLVAEAPNAPPVAPRGSPEAPTSAQMLVLTPQAAPLRVDDPVKKSEVRADDRFNLPPQ